MVDQRSLLQSASRPAPSQREPLVHPAKLQFFFFAMAVKIIHDFRRTGHNTAEKAGGQMEEFSLPTKIIAGAGAVAALESFGAKRVFVVTDPLDRKSVV